MSEILLVIPVLGRPQRAQPLYDSAAQATDVPHRILFMCSPGDLMQQRACQATGAEVELVHWDPGPGDYAMKMNLACRISEEPWIFAGADDLDFQPGWASAALAVARLSYCEVIGTNDGANPRVKRGSHSTHSLVSRRYIENCGTIDEPGKMLCEEYDHQFVDDELVETAQARDCFAFASGSRVTHLHPYFKTAEMDATYEKALRNTRADAALFRERRRLWA